jgi:chemotaxis protein MotA
MLVIVGCIVVIGAVLAGFTWAGGHVGALIHPSEVVTIGGAALGALIIMSSKKILTDLFRTLKGSPYKKELYKDLFKVSYDLLRLARRDGLIALETHVNDPHHSSLISKYPKIAHNHHAIEFLCGGLSPLVEGMLKPEQIPGLLETELKVIEEEHHAPLLVLMKTADGLPGFGIVAAVLGIVITMGAIDGPVEEIGHKVGAALVGTFLGILASYGFFGPLAGRMELLGHQEMAFFRTIASIIVATANDMSAKVAIEQARRGMASEVKLKRDELDQLFKEVDAG